MGAIVRTVTEFYSPVSNFSCIVRDVLHPDKHRIISNGMQQVYDMPAEVSHRKTPMGKANHAAAMGVLACQ